MPLFLLGLLLGALSGGGTYALTSDSQLAAIVGLIVAVVTWLGHALIVLVDD
ncbi:hypothetical protein [Streptomyces sp. NBRC 109706]|uniref:hypothetical protein n=1 Tax=Streptomyces sp. NBRC 109706 TaxID=1550035 RepID=UPI000A8467DF|nr:hypothetical protein [Streptomyces sp. NBRC 109706]